ncbi:PP2C family protein-serine/threonine phosphatase [Streptomyces sp. NPDC057909]|uniref:PP2C family protein-serine/threonine phosphatase n=1 Tax=Streptomyces sp. NPDC057909 TaxID=3346277 RepID=UPI0036EAD289
MPPTPWRVGGAQRQGRREFQADAFTVGGDRATGRIAACVTDGLGDTAEAAEAAQLAAEAAARATLTATPELGCAAARERLAVSDNTADASIVTALFDPGRSRIAITWAGICRAYALTDDGDLTRATYDHSLGEHIRRHTTQRGPLGLYDRKVTRTVARHEFVTTSLPAQAIRSVLLCSDGVSQNLADHVILRALAEPDPQDAAHILVTAAAIHSPDNATAVVLHHQP